jgi:hypothetical protein
MNRTQRIVLACGMAIMSLMGLFPPWLQSVNKGDCVQDRPKGYASVFAPPEEISPWYSTIDLKRLGVQEGAVLIGTIGLVLLTGSKIFADVKEAS